jgi:hypothetical protein
MYTSVLGKINKLHKKIIDQIMDRVSKQTVSSSINLLMVLLHNLSGAAVTVIA